MPNAQDDHIIDSDEETGGPADPHYMNVRDGMAVIERMKAVAAQDRIASKASYKADDCLGFSPSARNKTRTAIARFNHFRTNSLLVDDLSKHTFTMEHIIRFLDSVLDKLSLPSGKTAPNGDTIVRMFMCLRDYGLFTYKDFALTRGDMLRFKAHYEGLKRNKKITTGRWYKRIWFTFNVVSRITSTWLEHHEEHGAGSWDIVLFKALGVTLQAGLGCRSGDLALTSGYTDEYLRYEHLVVEFHEDYDRAKTPTIYDLRVCVSLLYTKGHKTNLNEDEIKHLKPLKTCFHMDPVLFLLIHALRHGLVVGTTLDEVLQHMAEQPDGKLKWTKPHFPVICAIKHDVSLDLPKRGLNTQLLHSLKTMSSVSGVIGRAHTHALRLGMAKDLVHLKQPLAGSISSPVRQALGHTAKKSMATAEGYAGEITENLLNQREELARGDTFVGKTAKFSSAPGPSTTLPATLTPQELQDYLIKEDPFSGKTVLADLTHAELSTIRLRIRAARRNDEDTMAESAADFKGKKRMAPKRFQVPEQSSVRARRASPVLEHQTDAEEELDRDTEFLLDMMADHTPMNPALEPRELSELDGIFASGAQSAEDEAEDDFVDVDEGVFTDPADFVNHYSKINTTSRHSLARYWRGVNVSTSSEGFDGIVSKVSLRGGSKDEPAPFIFRCSKTETCTATFHTLSALKEHDLYCSSGLVKAKQAAEALEALPCSHKGCTKSFRGEAALADHVSGTHTYGDRRCTAIGCTDTSLFNTREKMSEHQKDKHHPQYPRYCSHPDCIIKPKDPRQVFKRDQKYLRHLHMVHKLEKDEMAPYLPPPLDMTCPECSKEFKREWSAFKKHLVEKHSWSEQAATQRFDVGDPFLAPK